VLVVVLTTDTGWTGHRTFGWSYPTVVPGHE